MQAPEDRRGPSQKWPLGGFEAESQRITRQTRKGSIKRSAKKEPVVNRENQGSARGRVKKKFEPDSYIATLIPKTPKRLVGKASNGLGVGSPIENEKSDARPGLRYHWVSVERDESDSGDRGEEYAALAPGTKTKKRNLSDKASYGVKRVRLTPTA